MVDQDYKIIETGFDIFIILDMLFKVPTVNEHILFMK